MNDIEKTNLLKNRVQQEKNNSLKAEEISQVNNSIEFLINFVTTILGCYGAQWVLLTHFHRQPFGFLQSTLIFIAIISTLNYKK